MKKALSCIILCVLCLALTAPAFAAGKLELVTETLNVIPEGERMLCKMYYQFTNTGDKPVEFDSALLDLFDPDGNSIVTVKTDIYRNWPSVLQPGESGYGWAETPVSTKDKAFVDDHMLSIMGKGKVTIGVQRYKAAARFEKITEGTNTNYDWIAEIENDSDAVLRSFMFIIAIKDDLEQIIYLYKTDWNVSNPGIMPGSSVEWRFRVEPVFTKYWLENSISPAIVEIIAFSQRTL